MDSQSLPLSLLLRSHQGSTHWHPETIPWSGKTVAFANSFNDCLNGPWVMKPGQCGQHLSTSICHLAPSKVQLSCPPGLTHLGLNQFLGSPSPVPPVHRLSSLLRVNGNTTELYAPESFVPLTPALGPNLSSCPTVLPPLENPVGSLTDALV